MDPRSREESAFELRKSPSYRRTGWNQLQVLLGVVGALLGVFGAYIAYNRAAPANDGYVAKLEAQYAASQQQVAELKNALAAANREAELAKSQAREAQDKGFKLGAASRDAEIRDLRAKLLKVPTSGASKPGDANAGKQLQGQTRQSP